MTTVVVDVGNSRIKWGHCSDQGVVDIVSLPPDAPTAWQEQLERWGLAPPGRWLLASVQPDHCKRLADWLTQRHFSVVELDWPQLPLRVNLEFPGRVGIDRLLDAVAANSRRPAGVPAVVIDAGSAVTVDWVDAAGVFQGGAIFPGFRLMANALHDYTALLPLIEINRARPDLPGRSTPTAMEVGLYWAVVGGIQALTREYGASSERPPLVFLTGGDSGLLAPGLGPKCRAGQP